MSFDDNVDLPILNLKKSPMSEKDLELATQAIKSRVLKIAIICSRDFNDERRIAQAIYSDVVPLVKKNMYTSIELYCGNDGKGHNALMQLANQFKWSIIPSALNFAEYKKQAYFRRNDDILGFNPHIVIAFSLQKTPYIENFINTAYKHKTKPESNIMSIYQY